MIKGCERRMIKIENPDSELFESAYFIIRQNVPVPKKAKRGDMMKEAVRIVGDGRGQAHGSGTKNRGIRRYLCAECAVSFVLGIILTLGTTIVIKLIT